MAQPHVVTALIQKRAELAGQIDALQCDEVEFAPVDILRFAILVPLILPAFNHGRTHHARPSLAASDTNASR